MKMPASEAPDDRLDSGAAATAAASHAPDADDDPSASQVDGREGGSLVACEIPARAGASPIEYEPVDRPTPPPDALAARAFRGGVVTLGAQAIKFGLHIASVAVFARLLLPAEHGLVNMTTAFTGFALLFKDLGLSSATVQAKTVNQEQLTSVFWLMVIISLASMAVMIGLSPLIANGFYREPKVMPIMCGLSVSLLFGGLAAQHQALLRRNMKFKALAAIDVSAMAFGVVCGIVAALMHAGSWALVVMIVSQALAVAVMSWVVSDWRPSVRFSLAGTREMIRFGGFMTGFNVLNYCVRNVDNILIGKLYGTTSLGLYSKAYQLLVMPINQLTAPIGNVAHPALCRLHGAEQDDRWRQYYLNSLTMVAALTTPVVMFSFVMADEVVHTMLGPTWADATPLYRALAGAALVDTINVASGWAFISVGRTDRMFYWQIFETIATLAAFGIGAYLGGVWGIAIAFSIVRAGLRLPVLLYCYRTAPVTLTQTLRTLRFPFGAAFVASLMVWGISHFGYARLASPPLELLLSVTLFVPIYLACWFALPSGRAMCAEAGGLVRTSLLARRTRPSST